ncbi:MAG: hypothetical protein ABSC48_14185 [Terracidiphilus sp.]|jgi:hypothetical protein
MEISPVASVRIAPMIRSKETDLGLMDVYQIERPSRDGDETYTPSGARAESGLEEDEERNGDLESEAEGEAAEQRAGKIKISYIA